MSPFPPPGILAPTAIFPSTTAGTHADADKGDCVVTGNLEVPVPTTPQHVLSVHEGRGSDSK